MLVDGRHRSAVLDQNVEQHVERVGCLVGVPRGHDSIHRQALVASLAADEHPRPVAADRRVVVVPTRQTVADVLLQPGTERRVLQPLQHLGRPALVSPRRDDARQIVVAARVGIDVGLHVHAALASRLDQGDQFVHAAPQFLIGDLEVNHIHGDTRPLANRDRLLHGGHHIGPLVAVVRRVDAAVPGNDLAQLGDLIGRRQGAGRHRQHARQSERSVAHGFVEQFLHAGELLGSRPVEARPHHSLPDVVQPDIGRDVHGHARLLDGVEVFFQCGELPGLALGRSRPRVIRVRPCGVAFAEHLGRHTLPNLARGIAVLEQQIIRVRVNVDEPRRDNQTAGIDLARRHSRRNPADGDDPVTANGHVAERPRVPRPIDDCAVSQNQVIVRLNRTRRTRGQPECDRPKPTGTE